MLGLVKLFFEIVSRIEVAKSDKFQVPFKNPNQTAVSSYKARLEVLGLF